MVNIGYVLGRPPGNVLIFWELREQQKLIFKTCRLQIIYFTILHDLNLFLEKLCKDIQFCSYNPVVIIWYLSKNWVKLVPFFLYYLKNSASQNKFWVPGSPIFWSSDLGYQYQFDTKEDPSIGNGMDKKQEIIGLMYNDISKN